MPLMLAPAIRDRARHARVRARATRAAGPPAINCLTRTDFAFYDVPVNCDEPGVQMSTQLRGVKSRQGFLFLHRGFNQFDNSETAIPANAEAVEVPPDEWISKYFCDPGTLHGTVHCCVGVQFSELPARPGFKHIEPGDSNKSA